MMALGQTLLATSLFSAAIGMAVIAGCASNSSTTSLGAYDPVEHRKMVARGKAGIQATTNKVVSQEDEFISCFHRLEDDPDLIPIKGKIAITPKQGQPFDILTNNSKATKAEKISIRNYSHKALACMSVLDAPFKTAPAEAREAFNNSKNGMQSLLASLYLGDITYGGYAKRLSELLGQESKAIARAITEQQRETANHENLKAQQEIERNRAISAQQQARATQELVSTQRASNWLRAVQGFQQNIYQQQPINCTSRGSFGTVNTTCY
jgi:hypothetical protein